MKNKPAVKQIYDNLADYTVEQIQSAKIPLWFRERLIELKKMGYVKSAQAEAILISGVNIVDGVNSDVSGASLEYTGTERALGAPFSVVVHTDDFLFVTDDQPVFLRSGSHSTKISITELQHLKSNCKSFAKSTYTQYNNEYQYRLNNKYKGGI